MKFIDFKDNYPDEESCKLEFKQYRLNEGITCKLCGGKEHYWLGAKEQFQCKNNSCRFRTSIKSGTVMENSKLSFQYWFIAMHLMSASKMNFSALELQRQIGHAYYLPIFEMMHKLRLVMGKRDSMYQLEKSVELDEGYFTHTDPLERNEATGKTEKLKRGKGSQKQTKVLVLHSREKVPLTLEKSKHRHQSKAKFLKMTVIEDVKANTIDEKVKEQIKPEAKIISDDNTAYTNLKNLVAEHEPHNMKKECPGKILPWVHKAISNSKSIIIAIHHGVSDAYMQNYLNEYCFKYNRRNFGEKLFNRLLICSVLYTWN